MSDLLGSVVDIAKANAGREFLAAPDRGLSLTYGEFHDSACGLACRLEALGVRRQDRVLALLPNSPEYAILFFACLYMGATIVPVNPALHPRDVQFIIHNAGAKLIVFNGLTRHFLQGVAQPADKIQRWEMPLLTEPLFKLPWENHPWRPLQGVAADDIFTIVFTSGTTAFPKAIAHKIGSFLGNAKAFNDAMGLGHGDRFLHLLPMAYSGGFFNLLISPYMASSSIVMTPGFGPRSALEFWKVPMEHGVNTMWLTPTIASTLLRVDRDETGRQWCRSNIRRFFIGTAPLHLKTKRDFEAAYGAPLLESYGLSETLLVTAIGPKTGTAEGSVGLPLAGMSVSIRDQEGAEVPDGSEGEIFIKTPHLMAGQFDYEASAIRPPAEAGGWFASGDIGRRLAGGHLGITGREKDVIIRAGLNISPTAVEDVLLRHEAVAQAAVVGIPNDLTGEDIVAVVKPKPGQDWAKVKPDLESFCKASFITASRPSILLACEEIPTGATGKVLKNKVREWALGQLGRP